MPTKRQRVSDGFRSSSHTTTKHARRNTTHVDLVELTRAGLETETKRFRTYVVREIYKSANHGLGYLHFNALWMSYKFPAMNITWTSNDNTAMFNTELFVDVFKTELDVVPKIETQVNGWVLIRWS